MSKNASRQEAGPAGPVQIVVVDDVVRFALHVWRYLGRSLGFGIGMVEADAPGRFGAPKSERSLSTPDGCAEVWWVPADDQAVEAIERIRRQRESNPKLYLIDVKSPAPSYETRILQWVDGAKDRAEPPCEILLVSSYAPSLDRRVWPKSPATLQWVAERARSLSGTPAGTVPDGEWLDVLVTGAGFERREPPWEDWSAGGRPRGQPRYLGFGLPATGDVLWNMAEPFVQVGRASATDPAQVVALERGDKGFPWPCRGEFAAKELLDHMKALAADDRLDEWWDLLCENQLRSRLEPGATLRGRRAAKAEARSFEGRMREAFRGAIRGYDWGHLGQALAAARFPWAAWLTTNYTRFADRAIALTAQAKAREQRRAKAVGRGSFAFAGAPVWRLVATAQEAQLLIRELQDLGEQRRWSGEETPLFKLHGDVSHLQTMAIAGHDKDLYSGLSVPVDSLYQVYDAAEKLLLRLVKEHSGARVRFHVVGHGLKDDALVSVLSQVAGARDKEKKGTVLRLVSPYLPETPARLAELVTTEPCHEVAESYLATFTALHQEPASRHRVDRPGP